MKILFYSDLHFEFGKWPRKIDINEFDADVVVLAGDTGVGLQGLMWALMTIRKPVIYVMGNHEFYGQRTMEELWEKARAGTAGTHVHLLENESVLIDDPACPGSRVRFLGATLWTDFCIFGEDAQEEKMQYAAKNMNDYRQIRMAHKVPGYKRSHHSDARITPETTLSLHLESRNYLEQELALSPGSDESAWVKTVVVTHHAPSALSLEFQEPCLDADASYASHLDPLVAKTDLWVHGHTHVVTDYRVGSGRVVSNPRGYVGHAMVEGFNPRCIAEI